MTEIENQRKPRPKRKQTQRPPVEPNRIYPRKEAAFAVGVATITLIRAYDSGYLKAYRVGRRLLHSGQHLIDWLDAGGKTGWKKGGAA